MQALKLTQHPREVRRTGDNRAASSLWGYVWRMSEGHQVALCLIAVFVAMLSLIPIELQRRIVNEIVATQNVPLLLQFGAIYVGVILLHQAVKYGLWAYQSWISESTSLYTRRHLLGLVRQRDGEPEHGNGRVVSIAVSEVESLGGFVGQAVSGACANAAMLLGVIVYMFVVEPLIAAFALAFLIPQIALTPVIQRRLNRLVEARVGFLRDLGDDISDRATTAEPQWRTLLDQIYSNRVRFFLLKFLMKSALNLLNASGPITVLLLGGYLVMQGEAEVGVIVAFISGFERISSPLRELIGFYRIAAQANVQHDLIADWIDTRLDRSKD